MSVRGGKLLVRNRQILILVCREGRTLQEVHRLALVGIELVDDTGGITPAHEVEETLTLHGQLQTTFHLDNLHGMILVIRTVILTYCIAHAVFVGITRNDAVRHHTGSTLANLIDAQFSRIQFTPDLLPADVVGTMIYSQKEEIFQVKKGPVFANFVLADEINRAPAKVQSALLEAMQEKQVTIGSERSTRQEVHLGSLLGIELVDDCSGITPAHEVEETL